MPSLYLKTKTVICIFQGADLSWNGLSNFPMKKTVNLGTVCNIFLIETQNHTFSLIKARGYCRCLLFRYVWYLCDSNEITTCGQARGLQYSPILISSSVSASPIHSNWKSCRDWENFWTAMDRSAAKRTTVRKSATGNPTEDSFKIRVWQIEAKFDNYTL